MSTTYYCHLEHYTPHKIYSLGCHACNALSIEKHDRKFRLNMSADLSFITVALIVYFLNF